MSPKVLTDIEVEYAEAVGLLTWGDQLVLECVSYDQLCLARKAGAELISNKLLDAARLKRDLERRRIALSIS